MQVIDLNCDLGESFGNYTCGMDEEILPFVTSANIACGFHASDPLTMQRTVRLAKEHGVHVGAHPGFPDLVGFGRRNMAIPAQEITALVEYQIGALSAFCQECHIKLQHVKPHGALYNMAVRDPAVADAICAAIASLDPGLILLAPAGSEMIRAAKEHGLPFAREVFADRAYEEDGTLVPRSHPGAVITDEAQAIRRAVRMVKDGTVTSITGKVIPVEADSICVHGDNRSAVAFVHSIREALLSAGIFVKPLCEI